MARFDAYQRRDGSGYLLDCQTNCIVGLETRLVVPLLLFTGFNRPAIRLNPVFRVAGDDVVMMTQYAAAIESRQLGPRVCSLAEHQDAIVSAIDMLLSGF